MLRVTLDAFLIYLLHFAMIFKLFVYLIEFTGVLKVLAADALLGLFDLFENFVEDCFLSTFLPGLLRLFIQLLLGLCMRVNLIRAAFLFFLSLAVLALPIPNQLVEVDRFAIHRKLQVFQKSLESFKNAVLGRF